MITPAEFSWPVAAGAVAIAAVFIAAFSLVREPQRQVINALLIAGAGATYWSGGLGVWEFPFGALMLFMAYRGLKNYNFIAAGWLLHTAWDIVHHLYGNPIVSLSATSSLGCAICDPLLATWFFFKAPDVFLFFKRKHTA